MDFYILQMDLLLIVLQYLNLFVLHIQLQHELLNLLIHFNYAETMQINR